MHPEWQTLHAGDLVRAVPDGYLGGMLDTPGWRVAMVEPGRTFVRGGWGSFVVAPVDAATSRVLVRTRYRDPTWWGPIVSRLAFGGVHFVMERRMLIGLRDRAEGRVTPPTRAALAATGFASAVAGTLALLVLLLAPDAYLAFGLAFAALGALAVAVWALRTSPPARGRPMARGSASGVP